MPYIAQRNIPVGNDWGSWISPNQPIDLIVVKVGGNDALMQLAPPGVDLPADEIMLEVGTHAYDRMRDYDVGQVRFRNATAGAAATIVNLQLYGPKAR